MRFLFLTLISTAAATTCYLQRESDHCNGSGDDSKHVQAMLDACAGSALTVKAGAVCVTGPLVLSGHTQLHLEEGSVLRTKRSLWPLYGFLLDPPPFLKAANVTNTSIRGKGLIDVQGQQWWKLHEKLRPWSIFFDDAADVLLEDFTLLNPPCWSLRLGGQRFRVKAINITAPDWIIAPNTDGISVHARDVWISDVDITNGDDSIVMKDQAQNVLVENSVVRLGNGLVIGTSDNVDIHNVTFRNCTAIDTTFGCHIKFKGSQVGNVSGITYEDIYIYQSKEREQRRLKHGDWAGYAIGLHMNDQGVAATNTLTSRSTAIMLRNIAYRRIKANVIHGGEFMCNPGQFACRNITLDHVHLNASEAGCTFASAFGSGSDVVPEQCVPPAEPAEAIVV